MKFIIKSRGSADKDWNTHEIEADSQKDAEAQADKIYGVQRDKEGKQTNSDMVKIKVSKK